MKRFALLAAAGAMLVTGSVAVQANDKAIKARQAIMQLYAFNLGQLGAMVKGEKEYNADLAKASADNLVKASTMNGMAMWLPGTAMTDPGMEGKTWAKAEAWASGSDVGAKAKAMRDGAAAMAAVAGNGLDAVKGAIGGVGAACKGCHEKYRAPKN